MSLTIGYFAVQQFEMLNEQRAALNKMLAENKAESSAEKWEQLVKSKLEQIDALFNGKEFSMVLEANEKNELFDFFEDNYTVSDKLYDLMWRISSELDFFEVKIINEVINFAANCKTVEDLEKVWYLPKIDDDLDFKRNDFNQFMGVGKREVIDRCSKIKNTNPVYSECYVMVANHYGRDVGLLDFRLDIKKEIDKYVKKAAQFVSPEFEKILLKTIKKSTKI